MKGRTHVYKRDHINTDEIIPARYLNTDKETELAKHAMEDLDKNFVKKVCHRRICSYIMKLFIEVSNGVLKFP